MGMLDDLLAALAGAEVIARGPKSVGRAARPRAARALVAAVRVLRRRARLPARQHPDRAPDRGPGARPVAVGGQRAAPAGRLGRDGHRVPLRARRRPGRDVPDGRPGRDRRVDAVTFTSAPAVDICSTSRPPSGAAARLSRRSATACSPPASARSWRRSTCTASRCSSPAAPASPRWSAPSRSTCPPTRRDRGSTWPPAAAPRRQRLRVDGAEVALSPAPLAVLRALAERLGHVVSRRELLATCPAATPGASTRWRSPSDGSVPPSVHVWCRRSSSAATACRSPEEEVQ